MISSTHLLPAVAFQPSMMIAKPFLGKKHRIIHGNVLDFADEYRGEQFHALLCDPPYHLTSITKRFGGKDAAPAKFGADGAFARASRGFMNQDWDGGDIAFRPETWEAFGDLLLDGAFGMAFASTRGYHRMACAIEDAGFIIHPMICWAFGSGFPKATRIKGDDRFAGHRYGLQAIKPSLEPICVFQKPYSGRPLSNISVSGAGVLNIDAARIPGEAWSRSTPWKNDIRGGNYVSSQGRNMDADPQEMDAGGRWPANLVLAHSVDCTPSRCTPDCAVSHMSEQSGERTAGGSIVDAQSEPFANIYSGRMNRQRDYEGFGDTGTAARFFQNVDWQLENADPFFYVAKAGADERNRGLEGRASQTVGDGRQKTIDNAYQRGKTQRLNTHPTVKPIALTEWLAKLLLPPVDFAPRRLFVPFAGSGSEMIGASLAGWEVIYGVELSHDYAADARLRLDYYDDPLRTMRMSTVATINQPTLFKELS